MAEAVNIIGIGNIGDRNFEGRNDLEGTIWFNQQMPVSHFSDTFARKAIFTESVLIGSDFNNAELEGAHFESANLTRVNFTGANLQMSNLRGQI